MQLWYMWWAKVMAFLTHVITSTRIKDKSTAIESLAMLARLGFLSYVATECGVTQEETAPKQCQST